jgi:hypothetical protein
MALLTIVDAVRLTGVSRAQLYRYIKAGRISRTPDGFLDTAELLRAGLMLQVRDETVPVSMTHDETGPVSRETGPVSGVSSAHIQALERLIDVLQTELDAARERETSLLREAHERETLLLQMLSQMQQQNQRLLDMPRSAPASPLPGPRAFGVDEAPRGEMRRRIVALLQEHPEGLSPAQTRRLMGIDKDLGGTMKAMMRDGLLRRVETGRYAAGSSE